MSRALWIGFASLSWLACAPNPRPHDVSAADYEILAQREDRVADSYENAEAQAAGPHASQQEYAEATEHRRLAIEHRELADDYRTTSRELRAVEAEACLEVPLDQPDPLTLHNRISSVSTIEERSLALGGGGIVRPLGVRVMLRTAPNVSADELQRSVECRLARARTLGHDRPGSDASPLGLQEVNASVQATDGGVAVHLTSEDPEIVRQLLRWADRLLE